MSATASSRLRALAVVLPLACLQPPAVAAEQRDGWDVVRAKAPAFEVTQLGGGVLRSSDLAGKVVVIDFWATWCAPCVRELPQLSAYHQRLGGRGDVVLLSFNVGEDQETIERFLKRSPVSFPVYVGDPLVEPYELVAFPTKLIIDMRRPGADGSGTVRFRHEGLTAVVSIEARVAELLGETP